MYDTGTCSSGLATVEFLSKAATQIHVLHDNIVVGANRLPYWLAKVVDTLRTCKSKVKTTPTKLTLCKYFPCSCFFVLLSLLS